jgi:septum formation protein
VLASASPRRRELLEMLGLKFEIDPSRMLEPELRPGERPSPYAVRVARAKAREVAKRHASGLIVGADTIVMARGAILGKPSSREEARSMLGHLSGRWHEVFTGLCLIDVARGRSASACSRSRVHMRRLMRSEIDWYLSTGEFHDKAGAYAIQGFASIFIDRIEGCYFNIVGFPVYTFATLARRLGVPLLPGSPSESYVPPA